MNPTPEAFSQKKATPVRKFFGLWAVIYLFVFIVTSQFSPLTRIPFVSHAVIWFGRLFFSLPNLKKILATGSGDTTFDYVLAFFNLLFSLLLTSVLFIATRRKENYRSLYLIAIVIARYYVAYTMLVYGFAKVFNGQFGPVSYLMLEKKFGTMSPMAVLWNFMDTSRMYTFFGGLMEVIGGVLLLFRKTKTLGALFSLTVMINVAILNFAYDVPVKIFSTHIVLLCAFILSYEWIKLYHFFILHKTETLDYNRLSTKKKWVKIMLKSFKVLVLALVSWSLIVVRIRHPFPTSAPLEGSYKVHTFAFGQDTLPEGSGESIRWNRLYILRMGMASVVTQGNHSSRYSIKVNTSEKTLVLRTNQDGDATYASFTYLLHKDTLQLDGHIGPDSVSIVSIRKTREDYPLFKRGFHWINEYPHNN